MDEANNNNVTRMLRENYERDITLENSGSRQEEITTQSPTNDESWQVFADSQISLPLARLLKLVPRFTKKVAQIIAKNESKNLLVNFINLVKGPTIMDEQSPSINVIIWGQEVFNTS